VTVGAKIRFTYPELSHRHVGFAEIEEWIGHVLLIAGTFVGAEHSFGMAEITA
jgi:hypothetical protein